MNKRKIMFFFKIWGTLNSYQSIGKNGITFWEWIYKHRVSYKNAWDVAGVIHDKTDTE